MQRYACNTSATPPPKNKTKQNKQTNKKNPKKQKQNKYMNCKISK